MGKGSRPRTRDYEAYRKNFERIFAGSAREQRRKRKRRRRAGSAG